MATQRLLKEYRCRQCGKLLFKYFCQPSNDCLVEVKCDRCQAMSRVNLSGQGPEPEFLNQGALLVALFAVLNLLG